jgi:ribosomal protein S1
MKKLLKRIKTLWILSGWEVTTAEYPTGHKITGIVQPQQPKQAQIIKMNDPIKGFLQNENN